MNKHRHQTQACTTRLVGELVMALSCINHRHQAQVYTSLEDAEGAPLVVMKSLFRSGVAS